MEKGAEKRITITDIAKAAGLGRGTVSMAINDDPRIARETREKVYRICREMKYRPNEAARRLRGGKTGVIAYLCPRFTSPFAAELLAAAEHEAREMKRYQRAILPYSTWNLEEERDRLLEELLYSRRADAVVLMTIRPPQKHIDMYRQQGIPLVVVEFGVEGTHSIMVDNYRGGELAGECLAEKYGPDTAIVTGHIMTERGKGIHPAAAERMKGFRDALKKKGIRLEPGRVRSVYNYSRADGNSIMEGFLNEGKVPRSVFCAAGDETAVGLIETALKNGLRVPRDIAVVGYDDMGFAEFMNPALATIRQPLREIGRLAFRSAVEAADGKIDEPRHIVLQPELVIRESA